jgi:ferredoxin--NADP+ reductase
VITAIGYQTKPLGGLPLDGVTINNTHGWVRDSLYVVGWAKRGSSGTIPTNGPDSRNVIELLTNNLNKNKLKTLKLGVEATDKLLCARNVRVVSLADVEKITDAETANAAKERPWEKFTNIKEMLAVLD